MRKSHKIQWIRGDLMYQRIRDLREDSDTSQEVVAKLLNVSQTTYSRYETGNLDIPSQSLIKLAIHYSTSIDYLVGLTDCKKPYPRSSIQYKGVKMNIRKPESAKD